MFTKEKPEIEDSTNDFEGDILFVVYCRNYVIHSVAVSQVVDMEQVVSLLEQVERIKSVSLHASAPINDLPSITIEDRPFTILLPECLLETFTNSIDEVAIQFCSDL